MRDETRRAATQAVVENLGLIWPDEAEAMHEEVADAVLAVVTPLDKSDDWREQFELVEEARQRLVTSLVTAWSAYLNLVLDAQLEDGTSVLDMVLEQSPELRARLLETIYKPRGPEPGWQS